MELEPTVVEFEIARDIIAAYCESKDILRLHLDIAHAIAKTRAEKTN